ncbi:MAG: APC family permease [Sciscionella sp.]
MAITPSPNSAARDQPPVGGFGYHQELRRVLRKFALFAVAFSIVSITTGIFLNYGFGLAHLGPASIWLWPLAAVGQVLVALVLAELATHIPLAGANYQWGARLVGSRYGYLVGGLGILYGAVGLPGIMLLGAAPLTAEIFGWNTGNERLLLFIAVVLLVIAYLVNIVSVQMAARVNNIAVFTEIIGVVAFSVVVFFLWVAGAKPSGHGIGFLANDHGMFHQPLWYAAILAALIGVYTLVGFEAAADMAEEAVDARRTVPRAMIIAVVVSSVLGMVALIGFTVAIPDLAAAQRSPVPLADIASYWLGPVVTKIFLVVVVFSMFALTVVAAAANSRLIFAMARDRVLPLSSLLRRVNARTKTPLPALIASLLVCLALMGYGYADGNAFGTLVGATALVPYLVYLLTVVAYAVRRRSLASEPAAFTLGRWRVPVFVGALVWLVAVVLALTLPPDFRGADYVVLGGLALIAVWYVAGLHWRLRRGSAGVQAGPNAGTGAASVAGAPPDVRAVVDGTGGGV